MRALPERMSSKYPCRVLHRAGGVNEDKIFEQKSTPIRDARSRAAVPRTIPGREETSRFEEVMSRFGRPDRSGCLAHEISRARASTLPAGQDEPSRKQQRSAWSLTLIPPRVGPERISATPPGAFLRFEHYHAAYTATARNRSSARASRSPGHWTAETDVQARNRVQPSLVNRTRIGLRSAGVGWACPYSAFRAG